jgi:hypothetical protein
MVHDDASSEVHETSLDDEPQLPRHLAALVGALHGPADLAACHDTYLSYPHHQQYVYKCVPNGYGGIGGTGVSCLVVIAPAGE